jgi:hypothetical protein
MIHRGDVTGLRQLGTTLTNEMSTVQFKAVYQIESLLKRYRFSKDYHSDGELQEMAIKSFLDTQSRVADVNLDLLPASTQWILDYAAAYVSHVLGPYSDEEHRNLCRFGRRASVGIPARDACEAARWELPISGSSEQIAWFDSEMSLIPSVQEYWQKQKEERSRPTYHEVSSLKLTLVPKTFKSLRAIMPNTTIGSYMSYGLGEIIRKRLKRKGYDIATLQERHKYLARSASQHGLAVTADLSSASDSITRALVKRIFPPDWFDILDRSRIGSVLLPNGNTIVSETFCTMGIGYTFPLQTLVFLALLKGIETIMFHGLDRRTISVYGDDLIYSSRMHTEVVLHFQRIGFVINLDKTFHEGNFRESCGGDYYHGVDVRPFQPRNGSASVSGKAYEAILYKFVNGLLARWSEYEIGLTLDYLTSEIESVTGKCKLVPCSHPDDSGIKCPTLTTWSFLRRAKTAMPKHIGHGVFRFSYLRLISDTRKETRHEPYVWSRLRGGDLQMVYYHRTDHLQDMPTRTQASLDALLRVDIPDPLLITEKEKSPLAARGNANRSLRRKVDHVTISHTGTYKRQSGTSCFEDRR